MTQQRKSQDSMTTPQIVTTHGVTKEDAITQGIKTQDFEAQVVTTQGVKKQGHKAEVATKKGIKI